MVHDWLYEMHHCRIEEYAHYTVDDAAWIMTETMKTMIEENGGPSPGEDFVVYSMFEAVRSPFAVSVWNNGTCDQGGIPEPTAVEEEELGRIEYLLDFDQSRPR
jgi:hypothetical protein